jgi:hypothetical protein
MVTKVRDSLVIPVKVNLLKGACQTLFTKLRPLNPPCEGNAKPYGREVEYIPSHSAFPIRKSVSRITLRRYKPASDRRIFIKTIYTLTLIQHNSICSSGSSWRSKFLEEAVERNIISGRTSSSSRVSFRKPLHPPSANRTTQMLI